MKLYKKFLLILLFLICYFIFNSSDSYAVVNYTGDVTDIENDIDCLLNNLDTIWTRNDYFLLYSNNGYNDGTDSAYFLVCSHAPFSFSLYGNDTNTLYLSTETDVKQTFEFWPAFGAYNNIIRSNNTVAPKSQTKGNIVYDFYIYRDRFIATNYTFANKVTGEVLYEYETAPDKLNLFELNLTDLEYNNTVHQFNLATYTDSDCYDELMQYYNQDKQYAIFVTDYTRIMTYNNYDDDSSYRYGSYFLSGYIDFLIDDDAYFYFSPYYNQVMSNNGSKKFNLDVSSYTKRFYFKLTYSEDSNDPHATIWANNGNLYKTDYLEYFEDRQFIGSSQTIYKAEEKSNHNIKSLKNDIYYLGYLGTGKTRDITNSPFYVYNFSYGGGSTETYIINQNDYNYEDAINNRYDNFANYYDDWTIITDSTGGSGYIQGNDFTTSTFSEDNEVTDDSSTESDLTHIGEISTPSQKISTDGDSEDTTNWGVFDFLRNIFYKIGELATSIKNLLIPPDTSETESNINNAISNVNNKFSFKDDILNSINIIKETISNTVATNKVYININSKYYSNENFEIDFSWYAPYKPMVDSIICAFCYISFVWSMFKKLPNLIKGNSADVS